MLNERLEDNWPLLCGTMAPSNGTFEGARSITRSVWHQAGIVAGLERLREALSPGVQISPRAPTGREAAPFRPAAEEQKEKVQGE